LPIFAAKTALSVDIKTRDYTSAIQEFQKLLSHDCILTGAEEKERYGRDETEDLFFMPDIVLKPNNTEEVSRIMQICYEHNIPVTPRGAGTGLSGGA